MTQSLSSSNSFIIICKHITWIWRQNMFVNSILFLFLMLLNGSAFCDRFWQKHYICFIHINIFFMLAFHYDYHNVMYLIQSPLIIWIFCNNIINKIIVILNIFLLKNDTQLIKLSVGTGTEDFVCIFPWQLITMIRFSVDR